MFLSLSCTSFTVWSMGSHQIVSILGKKNAHPFKLTAVQRRAWYLSIIDLRFRFLVDVSMVQAFKIHLTSENSSVTLRPVSLMALQMTTKQWGRVGVDWRSDEWEIGREQKERKRERKNKRKQERKKERKKESHIVLSSSVLCPDDSCWCSPPFVAHEAVCASSANWSGLSLRQHRDSEIHRPRSCRPWSLASSNCVRIEGKELRRPIL